MDSCCGNGKMESDELVESQRTDDFQGPVKNRSCTDVFWLGLLFGFTLTLIGLLTYCIVNGDPNRLIYGYDNCGNVCGQETKPVSDPEFSCTGGDMTNKKILLVGKADQAFVPWTSAKKECIESCAAYPDHFEILNRCIKKPSNVTKKATKLKIPKRQHQPVAQEQVQEQTDVVQKKPAGSILEIITSDIQRTWVEIIYLSLLSLVFSFGMLVLLRYLTALMVWVVMIGMVALCVAATIALWLGSASGQMGIFPAIVMSIVTLIVVIVLIVMRKKIRLVVSLFRESGKAIGAMPLLLVVPIVTFIPTTFVFLLFGYFSVWIESAGSLTKEITEKSENIYYQQTAAVWVTKWYNLVALFWYTQFLVSAQHMVIAGAVAKWYFLRAKSTLSSPIFVSFCNTFRYHLGSIAFGSFLITVVAMLKAIVNAMKNNSNPGAKLTKMITLLISSCILDCINAILSYITRNAYIEISIYGETFCQAGKRALNVLTTNPLNVTAINTIGDTVLLFEKLMVVGLTLLIGYFAVSGKEGVTYVAVPLVIVAIIALYIAHCFVSVYEMTIDTIFICFSEDCKMNDGLSKPYFMNKSLMEFVENSKKVLGVKDKEEEEVIA